MKTSNGKALFQLWVRTTKDRQKLAEKFDRYEYELVHDAVKYFEKSGYNPAEMEERGSTGRRTEKA